MSGNRQASDLTARIQARTLYANVIATRKLIEQGCNITATTQSGSGADKAESLLPTLALGARLTTAAERDAILAPVCAPVGCLLSGDTLTILQFTTVGATTWECPCSVTSIEYLVVGGGGGSGGGYDTGGGGGGGSGLVLAGTVAVVPNTIYAVEVGDGGAGGTVNRLIPVEVPGGDGGTSSFDSIQASGGSGGFGSRLPTGLNNGGGGSQAVDPTGGGGGRGGGSNGGGGGGGGNSSAGGNKSGATPGSGGAGVSSSISGTTVTYGAGGNGAPGSVNTSASAGAANTGNGANGGGGGSGSQRNGAVGGSGIVIIKYYA